MTYNYNPDYLFNYTISPCEIGDYASSVYEYIDDEHDFKIEYDHRIQLVEADTDTGADYGDEDWGIIIKLWDEKRIFIPEDPLTFGSFQDLVQGIIQGLNHGYKIGDIVDRR